jgi:hypothetical protein
LDFYRASSSQSGPSSDTPRTSQQANSGDDERGSIDELYVAGACKGALVKLPAKEERVAVSV